MNFFEDLERLAQYCQYSSYPNIQELIRQRLIEQGDPNLCGMGGEAPASLTMLATMLVIGHGSREFFRLGCDIFTALGWDEDFQRDWGSVGSIGRICALLADSLRLPEAEKEARLKAVIAALEGELLLPEIAQQKQGDAKA